ncbi:hypothetical protein A2U01_0062075 [Trifolium medium]|uniref:Uncharacterized protein n=1 Tax=Trifolium medium TaxID=97028 RepID=A0A392RXF1_9FABA|nr:hypothetical protein [Trifolium medium]
MKRDVLSNRRSYGIPGAGSSLNSRKTRAVIKQER